MILNSHQMSPNFLVYLDSKIPQLLYYKGTVIYEIAKVPYIDLLQLWLGMGVFLVATGLRVYAICQQLQAQAQAHAAAGGGSGGIVGHTEFRLRMPPSIAFATRGRLQGLRLQLALLDRDFDDLGKYSMLVYDLILL